MKPIFLFPFIAAPLLLSGCVSAYLPPAPPASDPASTQLAESAVSVTHSLTTLEGIRKAENPQYEKKLPSPNSFNMFQLSSIDLVGPIQPLVVQIARASGYQLRVLGTPPAIPIIISIHAKNQPLAEILRNTDYQAGRKAYIKVSAKHRTIELRYART